MTENVKENTPIIRVKELEKYFLAKRGYIHMSQYVKAVGGITDGWKRISIGENQKYWYYGSY